MAKRRGRGEGTIVERADGRWMARADLGWQDGKRRRKTLYGSTRREVARKLTDVLRAAQHGDSTPDERQTVETYLSAWLKHKQTTLRPRAHATYEQAVDLHLVPGLGKVRLARLSPAQVQAWFTHHRSAGASARTIRYARTVLRAALNQALRWSLVARNAAALVEAPRHVARSIQPLNPMQARTLLAATDTHRLGALVSVGLALGLRLGEALGLRWADVDFDAGLVRVEQALERSGGDRKTRKRLVAVRRALLKERNASTEPVLRAQLHAQVVRLRSELRAVQSQPKFVEPKSARSRRAIRVPDVVVARLRQHRKRQLEERLVAGRRWQESALVFTTRIGTALDARNISREFTAILKDADLPAIRFHDLRHTAATLLLAQGVDARTIMEILGHSQISLTLNTYSHVLPVLQTAAAKKMNAILGGE